VKLLRPVLVTGATGYTGGRLVPRRLEANCQVRCLVRDPARLQGRAWLARWRWPRLIACGRRL
jgi:uncharacterized protein YbjT (DUF2867 family)